MCTIIHAKGVLVTYALPHAVVQAAAVSIYVCIYIERERLSNSHTRARTHPAVFFINYICAIVGRRKGIQQGFIVVCACVYVVHYKHRRLFLSESIYFFHPPTLSRFTHAHIEPYTYACGTLHNGRTSLHGAACPKGNFILSRRAHITQYIMYIIESRNAIFICRPTIRVENIRHIILYIYII